MENNQQKIVYKVEEGTDPRDVYCTTYQMRNFYRQFADGFFTSLDVMNYIQHHKAVLMMKPGYRVLDVCCGRGLLLPLIRWHRKDIAEYVGVDISENNIKEQTRRSGIKLINGLDYYPFKVTHKIGSVEEMSKWFPPESFHFIVYTSAIEHMQKEVGLHSLRECFSLLKAGGNMFISTPNTRTKRDPYDTQYAAHLYEWNAKELLTELKQIGFKLVQAVGLVAKKREFDKFILTRPKPERELYAKLSSYFPTEWLMSFAACQYPAIASEVLFVVKKP